MPAGAERGVDHCLPRAGIESGDDLVGKNGDGGGSRVAAASPARTGTWSDSVGKTLGNIFRAPFDLVQLLAPLGSIPDLEVVVDAGHRDFPAEAGMLEQGRRKDEPALLVELP